MKMCSVNGCEHKSKAKGLCYKHYEQKRLHGEVSERTRFTPNEIELFDDFALLHLYKGERTLIAKAIIDLEDVERVAQFKWSLSDSGYVIFNSFYGNRYLDITSAYLQHFVMNSNQVFDHKNTNKLDNRKENLRPCTYSQNQQNKNIASNNTSGAKGVHWAKDKGRYVAYITLNRKRKYLGYFDCLIKAAERYNEAAKEMFGEFALLNDIEKLKQM